MLRQLTLVIAIVLKNLIVFIVQMEAHGSLNLFCVLYFDRVKLVQKILAPPTILNHLFNIFM